MTTVLAQVIDTGDISSAFDSSSVTLWDTIAALVVLVVGYLLARWARRALNRTLDRVDEMPETIVSLAGSIVFWFTMAIAIVVALGFMGFDTAPIVLVLLIAAVVVVLSGRALLENYGASLILQVRSPFEPGDQIQSGDYRGEVVEINGRTVVIATMDGKEVHIPNSTVVSNAIVNLTTRGRRRSRLDVGVEYGTDLGQARRVLTDTVTGVPGVLDDPAPEVFVTEFDDSAINFAVRYWHEPTIRDGFVVTDDVARAIDVALAAAGIVIAFPQATLWWGDAGSHDSEQTPT